MNPFVDSIDDLTRQRAMRSPEIMEPELPIRIDPMFEGDLPGEKWLTDGKPLALVAIKEEARLELWKKREKWLLVKVYPFTGNSGVYGPKLREGDFQIPEGLYEIEGLNPQSRYHLSMRVNYPNAFDRRMAQRDGRTQLGGDIYIHGSDVTVGCIPLGDEPVEELFGVVKRNGYRGTRIIIAPYDMRRMEKSIGGVRPEWRGELYEKIEGALSEFPVLEENS